MKRCSISLIIREIRYHLILLGDWSLKKNRKQVLKKMDKLLYMYWECYGDGNVNGVALVHQGNVQVWHTLCNVQCNAHPICVMLTGM